MTNRQNSVHGVGLALSHSGGIGGSGLSVGAGLSVESPLAPGFLHFYLSSQPTPGIENPMNLSTLLRPMFCLFDIKEWSHAGQTPPTGHRVVYSCIGEAAEVLTVKYSRDLLQQVLVNLLLNS